MSAAVFRIKMAQILEESGNSVNVSTAQKAKIEKEYLAHVLSLINDLNQCDDADSTTRAEILEELHEANRIYLATHNITQQAQILFTRHGESTPLAQKALGFTPNAPISSAAQEGMARTNFQTMHLLASKHRSPRIIISPLTRTLQTAGYVIPQQLTHADISIEPALQENSFTPSGFDLRSQEDLTKYRNSTSFWREPFKVLWLWVSSWFYGESHFSANRSLRTDAIKRIQDHNGERSIIEHHGDVTQDLSHDEQSKVVRMEHHIRHATDTLWLFGHGNNFTNFFSKVFGVKIRFDYAETQSVFKVTDQSQNHSFFIPPYTLLINQRTGNLEGKFKARTVFTSPHQSEISASNVAENPSYAVMHRSGLQANIQAEAQLTEISVSCTLLDSVPKEKFRENPALESPSP